MTPGSAAPYPRRAPRSLLYVPAHDQRLVGGAHKRGADAIILDLEDAVPEASKAAAREALPDSVQRVSTAGAAVLVRVNSSWSLAWRDLEAAVAAGAGAVVLPKAQSPGQVEVVGEYLDELDERHRAPGPGRAAGEAARERTGLLLIVEDAPGLQAVAGMAAVLGERGGLGALIPGNQDLALSLGVEPTPELLLPALWPLITAAKANRLALLGSIGGSADYHDLEAYRQRIEFSRARGFTGATCIHPRQVAVANEVHGISLAELQRARDVVEAFEAGTGAAVGLHGTMIDRPVYLRAKGLLEAADEPAPRAAVPTGEAPRARPGEGEEP